jgi:hypothetical protein
MHWYRDCPKKNVSSNQVNARSPANRTPMGRNKWPQKGTDERNYNNDATARANIVETQASIEELNENESDSDSDQETCLPSQQEIDSDDEERQEDADYLNADTDQELDQYRDKVPTYAEAKIDQPNGINHHICIDTGSAISIIDSAYVKRYLPNTTIHPSSTIRLNGIGYNSTRGWISTTLYFLNRRSNYIEIPVIFHVAQSISTKIILGNDVLVEQGATVNLADKILTFKTAKGAIPVTSTIYPTADDNLSPISPSARTKQVFNAKPGHQVKVPVTLSASPKTASYYLDPCYSSSDLVISRSVGTSASPNHYVHVMNMGQNVVTLPSGSNVASVCPFDDRPLIVANVTQPQSESQEDKKAFEEASKELDCNPDLSPLQKKKLEESLRQNRLAFS